MVPIRIVAIPTKVAEFVRSSLKAPGYGHPAHREVAAGYGPCRHCLHKFAVGEESRILFTYDPFFELESVPLPGPIFVHASDCRRYPEICDYPEQLRDLPALLCAYGEARKLMHEIQVTDGTQPTVVNALLKRPEIRYLHVRDLSAGCYDFRVERA
ncbi:MAG TPA: DUF1203 domain-containing protein [Candidatus Limnocylindrales bacterium]|nr:DUF1203 domain-containing protein [Candidatus Limnocylindrales bacterium]